MYSRHVHFYCQGCPDDVVETWRAAPPLKPFSHSFSQSPTFNAAMCAGADAIFAAIDSPEDLAPLLENKKPDTRLVVLPRKPDSAIFDGDLSEIQDIWPLPSTRAEAAFRFLGWQKNFKLENDLWEREQFLQAAIDNTPNMLWFKDKKGIHERVNASFCKIVNKTREQVQGRGHAYIWNVEKDDPACIESERLVMETGKTRISEENITTSDGERLLITYKSPLRNWDGDVMGTVGVAIDRTEEQKYHQKLLENSHTLETIFTTMDCGILSHSLDGAVVLSANRVALKILGYETLEELQQKGFDMVAQSVLDEDKPKLKEVIKSLRNVGESASFEYRVDHGDGNILHIMGNARLVEQNGELVCQRFLLDCTTQKLREERERQKREKRQLELMRALSVDYQIVCVVDEDSGELGSLHINESEDCQFGNIFREAGTFPESMRLYAATCVHEEDKREFLRATSLEAMQRALASQPIYYFNYRAKCGPVSRYFQIKAVRAGAEDENYGIVIGFQSVDAQTRLELEKKRQLAEALKQAKRASNAKTVFLSNMSHDIRTPMNAIVGYTALALSHLSGETRVEEYLKKIMSSGNHLLNLINDILDMSHIESGKMRLDEKLCSLQEISRGLWNILLPVARGKSLDLRFDAIGAMDEGVYCDKLRLNQVLLNLLGNSVKYTLEGGFVSMRMREISRGPDNVGLFEFLIEDTGIGMSQEFVERIFEPFERERTSTTSGIQGTGLGMPITKNIVTMMKGDITVESQKGVGTRFRLLLPLRVARDGEFPESEGSVLVAMADKDVAAGVVSMLERAGLETSLADSGKLALEKTAEHDYDFFILDEDLGDPGGMELASALRRQGAKGRIILAAYERGAAMADLPPEVDARCVKPIFWSELRSCLWPPDDAEESDTSDRTRVKRSGHILLAEDNPMNQEIAAEILRDAGYVVHIASNGREALDMLVEGGPGRYDLILMDVQMPVMDGYAATRLIRNLEDRKLAKIPIVAMTANTFEEDKLEAMRTGMNAHVAKPIDFNTLFRTLDSILGS